MKLIDRIEVVCQRLRLARNTQTVYISWVKQYLRFSAARHGVWKHPVDLATTDVEAFLNDLVLHRRLSASIQNQALNALVFLYKRVCRTLSRTTVRSPLDTAWGVHTQTAPVTH